MNLQETSAEAMQSVPPEAFETMRQLIFEFIQLRGKYGATREEIWKVYPEWKWNSFTPRVCELLKYGFIKVDGTRKNMAGRNVQILVVEEE